MLALAFALPIVAWAWGYRRRIAFEDQFEPAYISAAPRSKVSFILSSSKLAIYVLASALLISVLLGMGNSERKISASNDRKTLCLVIDVSSSMLAPEGDESRLARAKKSADIIIGNTDFDCISVVAFAGSASLVLPPTPDFATARALISSLDPTNFEAQGSSVNRAIELAALSRADSSGFAACVLLSDGEFHDEANRDRITRFGLPVHCLLFGSKGERIPMPRGGFLKDAGGEEVVSVPNPESLKKIAQWTNGSFIVVDNYDVASRFAKEALAIPAIIPQSNPYDWKLIIAFILLTAFLFVPEHRDRSRLQGVAITIFIIASVDSFGIIERHFDQGFTEYRNANYSLAAEHFRQAAEAESDSSRIAICLYNQANALYKNSFVASGDSTKQLIEEAIELYKQSLRAQPSDSMAQYNLTMALIRLSRLNDRASTKDTLQPKRKHESQSSNSLGRLNAQEMKQLMQLAKRNSFRPNALGARKGSQSEGRILKPW